MRSETLLIAVKPLALMERLAAIALMGGLVLNPFVGSGSTRIAGCGRGGG
jgi:hypothetical protein